MSEQMISTYSMWSMFRNCRKACEWRYLKELVPLEKDHNLSFGSMIHECLELWHRERDLAKVLDHIDRAYPNRAQDEGELGDWHLATAMMKGYAARYQEEEFEVVGLEQPFEDKIINPATGASSRSFTLAGKVDGIVRRGDEHFLLEHKTASQVDADYLERHSFRLYLVSICRHCNCKTLKPAMLRQVLTMNIREAPGNFHHFNHHRDDESLPLWPKFALLKSVPDLFPEIPFLLK